MKILQIIYSLSSGGAERLSVDLCNELVRTGHEVHLCVVRDLSDASNRFYLPLLRPEVHIINLSIPRGFSFRYFFALFKTISSVSPDVVHSHLNIIRYLFPLRAFFPAIRFIHTIHNDAPVELSGWWERIVTKLFFRKGWMHAITISDATTRSFDQCYGFPPAGQIYNGRSAVHPSEQYEATRQFMQSLRTSPATVVLLHVGRFAPQKNQPMLVHVIHRLVAEGHDIQLILAGDGYDAPEARALQSLLPSVVHMVGEQHQVGDYYYGADGFCLSSLHEGMPITLIEAMACGCIPICTPAGGCSDIIQNGVTGFLSADCSEQAYYEAMVDFLRNRGTIDRQGLVAYFSQHLSIQRCTEKYLAAYRS